MGMKSGLDLTSSSAHLYVENAYKQMSAGLQLSSSSACLYAKSRTSKAEIIARINEDGSSEALINGDRVTIQGRTTINDVMTISDRRLLIKVPTRCSEDMMLNSITMRDGNNDNTINPAQFSTIIRQATVSGNVLTLTRIDGSKVNFSKATTLSGTWSGSGKLKVSAKQNDVEVASYERLLVAKPESGGYVPIYAQWGSSGQYEEDTGFRVSVSTGTPSALAIYDTNARVISSQSITGSIDMWSGYSLNGSMTWGDKVTITAHHDVTVRSDVGWYVNNVTESTAKTAAAQAMGTSTGNLTVKELTGNPTHWCWSKVSCGSSTKYVLYGF